MQLAKAFADNQISPPVMIAVKTENPIASSGRCFSQRELRKMGKTLLRNMLVFIWKMMAERIRKGKKIKIFKKKKRKMTAFVECGWRFSSLHPPSRKTWL